MTATMVDAVIIHIHGSLYTYMVDAVVIHIRAVGEEGVEGDGGSGDNGGRAGLGHRLVAAWARVRAAFGDG